MNETSSVRFVTDVRGGWDEWSDTRRVVTTITLPDGDELSPFGDVRVERDGDEFTASLEPVNSFGEISPDRTHVQVESWRPEFSSDPLSEAEFAEAWGDWLFPAE